MAWVKNGMQSSWRFRFCGWGLGRETWAEREVRVLAIFPVETEPWYGGKEGSNPEDPSVWRIAAITSIRIQNINTVNYMLYLVHLFGTHAKIEPTQAFCKIVLAGISIRIPRLGDRTRTIVQLGVNIINVSSVTLLCQWHNTRIHNESVLL